jgi:hypothetical protein
MTTTTKNETNYLADRFLQNDKERFHPDLHSALEARHKGIKMEHQTGKDGILATTIFSPYDMYEEAHQKAFDAEVQAFIIKNKPEVKRLFADYQRIEAEMAKADDAIKRSREANSHNYSMGRNAWKTIAKELGIHKYLTDNGGLSKAKLMRAVDKIGKSEATVVLEKYNKQYVPAVNKAMADNQSKKKSVSADDSKAIQVRNGYVNEINALRKQISLLSANSFNVRSGEFSDRNKW